MHKEKNFLLDEQILSFKVDPHLRKAAKIYGTTSTDPDQSVVNIDTNQSPPAVIHITGKF